MKSQLSYFFTLLITSSLSMSIAAQEGLPPLIDREILFGNPEISTARLSPDGKYISFIKPYNEVRNIWVKEKDQAFDEAKPVTADTNRPIRSYFWSRDGKHILYAQDKGGDENFHVYSVDPSGERNEETGVPESIDLTPMEDIRAYIMSVPKSDEDKIYVGINDRDKAWHDLYKVSISTGEKELVLKNDMEMTGSYFDLNDELKMISKSNSDGGTEFLKLTEGGFKTCYSCTVDESCYPVKFNQDGKVYFVSNKGDVDLTQFGLLDLDNDSFTVLESDPENKVDFGNAIFSDLTEALIGTSYTGDKERIYWRDKRYSQLFGHIQGQFPDAEISVTSMTKDESLWIIYANSDTDPGAAYLFDVKTKETTFLYRPRPNLPVEHLAKMTPVRYSSKDGLEIPAYLTLPKGIDPKNLPALVVPHGGPWARDNWGYNSFAQFLANRGYVVIQPNFRGSTGFGKAFLNAGNNEWGQKMQDDLTAAAEYLVEKGYADPKKIGIMGGSYGGYATLAGLTFTPDVYALGISIVGPSNLFTLLETIPPYWESFRKVFHVRMGNPETEEGRAQLERQSPLFHAKNIKVPLLVAQGANDPRVKKAESDQIVFAMRELGLPVEYLNFPDEGHGFANPDNNIAFLYVAEKFLAKHLGGRFQEEIKLPLQRIVKKVTVDINTVEMPKKLTDEMATAALPMPVKSLTPSKIDYDMTIEMGEQKIPMSMTRTIEDAGDNWKITDKATSPMGEILDVCTVSKKNLAPLKREINQGPVNINMDLSDTSIKGNMKMQGNDTPIEAELLAPTFSDGAALGVTLGALPLEEGYTTMYRIFDATKQKVLSYKLTVTGSENITLGDATIDTYIVETESLDGGAGQKMWFDKSEAKLVKLVANLPEMGGAKMTIMIK